MTACARLISMILFSVMTCISAVPTSAELAAGDCRYNIALSEKLNFCGGDEAETMLDWAEAKTPVLGLDELTRIRCGRFSVDLNGFLIESNRSKFKVGYWGIETTSRYERAMRYQPNVPGSRPNSSLLK